MYILFCVVFKMEDIRQRFFLFYSAKTPVMYIETQSLEKEFFKICLKVLQTFVE